MLLSVHIGVHDPEAVYPFLVFASGQSMESPLSHLHFPFIS